MVITSLLLQLDIKKKLFKIIIQILKEFTNLKIIDTGKETMTGGRLLRLKLLF